MQSASFSPSNGEINRAGKALRSYMQSPVEVRKDPRSPVTANAVQALDLLVAWRTAHAVPLQSASMGLRSRVSTAKCTGEVSQRLKRVPTILGKLVREPGMNLARMADIGGCRAILSDLDEVRRVQARFEGSDIYVRTKDYIAEPKASGYRAVHIIVGYSDRKIEVQLRTKVMHEWAYTVELTTSRLKHDVKSGKGPQPVLDWFEAVSRAMAMDEQGLTVGAILTQEVATLRELAMPYIRGGQQ